MNGGCMHTNSTGPRRARVLIVAGHDSSGGAGVDADRASLRRLPIEAVCVVTAYTDQDDRSVRALGARPVAEWSAEVHAALAEPESELEFGALKFGLLPGAEHVRAAAEIVRTVRAKYGPRFPVIVDPVLGASSGARFLDCEATIALRRELASAGVILTPNLPEALELAGLSALDGGRTQGNDSLALRVRAARILIASGADAVIVKGGHGAEDPVQDLVLSRDGVPHWLRHRRELGGKVRGSGCRFASRLAGELALGRDLESAARAAGRHVARLIATRARWTQV